MTTFAPKQDNPSDPRREQIEERRRAAWGEYAMELQGLDGREYEEAERRSWDRLQRRLADLDRRSSQLASSSTRPRPE